MIQYFKEILTTFSTAQRIWALIILCISVFFITFGSDIIDAITPDPEQQSLIVRRQRNVIVSLNTQLDSLTLRVDDLTQKVIDGQSDCSNKRIQREKEIIAQIDEIMNMVKCSNRSQEMVKHTGGSGRSTGGSGSGGSGSGSSSNPKITPDTVIIYRDEPREIVIDNSKQIMKGLNELKNKIRNKK